MASLPIEVREALRMFAFYLGNGTVDVKVLGDGYNYDSIFTSPSDLEMVFAIWANHLEYDEEGNLVNAYTGRRRAAQYIRRYIDPSYIVDPPFEDWEIDLH
jgi:hypothetical protein